MEISLYNTYKIIEHQFFQGSGFEVQEKISKYYKTLGIFDSREEAINFIEELENSKKTNNK